MAEVIKFETKEGAGTWTAGVYEVYRSVYDIALFVDQEKPTKDSGWMLELGVNVDGSIFGHITAHPGFDGMEPAVS